MAAKEAGEPLGGILSLTYLDLPIITPFLHREATNRDVLSLGSSTRNVNIGGECQLLGSCPGLGVGQPEFCLLAQGLNLGPEG